MRRTLEMSVVLLALIAADAPAAAGPRSATPLIRQGAYWPFVATPARIGDVGQGQKALYVTVPGGGCNHWNCEATFSLTDDCQDTSEDARPERDALGVELDMLGARSMDEAVQLAHATPAATGPIDVRDACTLLRKASTPAGFRASATPGARLVDFGSPGAPADATRIVAASELRPDDVRILGRQCERGRPPGPFRCHEAICGQLDSPLGNLFRFARVAGSLELDLALIYVGT